jgi:ABC-2 type transport system permease protein
VTARLIRAEWTKARTVPSTGWLCLAIAVSTAVLGAIATASVHTSQCPSPSECFEDTTKLALTGVWLSQATAVVLATLAVTTEYDTRMIQTTHAVMPRRPAVLMAKAASVSFVVLVAGTVGVLGSLVAGRTILLRNGFTIENGYQPLSLADGATLRAAMGSAGPSGSKRMHPCRPGSPSRQRPTSTGWQFSLGRASALWPRTPRLQSLRESLQSRSATYDPSR